MSRFSTGSGKFVPVISTYVQTQKAEAELGEDVKTIHEDVIIPQVPANPDARPKLIQYAEEYFGRYWFVTLAVLLVLLFRRK
ncbi:MAG: hypothetical protein IKU01_02465 [Bacteroidales bacterium]|nr:hypothetical protein [Bacteroidales bacterium]